MDSNVSGSQPITKTTTKPNITKPTGKGFYTGGKHQTPGGTNVTSNLSSNNTKIPTAKTTNVSGKTFKQFTNISGKTSNVAKLKVTPKNLAGKALGPAIAAWNFKDNYTSTKGSALRKFTKAALKTGAYYAGASGGAAVGTAGGSFTGPGAFVTGAIGAITGGETASNLADKAFNKIWKPPTTKTKEKDKKVAVPPTGGDKNKGYTWKTGISIGPSSKK